MAASGAILSLGDGRFLVGFGEGKWRSTPSETCFYFPDFFLENETPWLVFEEMRVLSKADFPVVTSTLRFSALDEQPFAAMFAELKQEIHSGRLRKGVPYAFLEGEGEVSVGALLQNALRYPELFIYGFWNEEEGIFGATPEKLFTTEEKRIKTVAIAGTMGKHHKTVRHFLEDPKERQEHEWVIEGIRNSLSPYGVIQRGDTYASKAGPLTHLKTDLEGVMDAKIEELILALHPTPALGAYPKNEGESVLRAFEKRVPRSRFGAPVGAVYLGKANMYVAIRNVQWEGERIRIGAGAGVVAESELAKEWAEVQRKMRAIREVLGLD